MITCDKRHLIARCSERGYKLDDVMPSVFQQDGDLWTIDPSSPHYPHPKPKPEVTPPGAGTALKGLLKLIGITSTPTCKCNARARTMDDKGLQWCRDNEELIAGGEGWLAEEAGRRSLPYSTFAGKKLLKLAIYRGSKYPDARP
jgi:hypothetical protein